MRAIAVAGDRVVILGDSLISVPLAGGAPTVLAHPHWAEQLFAIGGTVYYAETDPDGGIVPGSGGPPLMAVPATGGTLRRFLSAFPALMTFGGTDAASYYFSAVRRVGDAGGISKLTPPSTEIVALTTERFVPTAFAPYGDHVYFIGNDLDLFPPNGFIGRVAKQGGYAERVVADVGMATGLVADHSGLYWRQPKGRWSDGIQRSGPYTLASAALDGSWVRDPIADDPGELALANGRVYFTRTSLVLSVATNGDFQTTIAANQQAPAMLKVSGSNLLWVTGLQGPPDAGAALPVADSGVLADGSGPRYPSVGDSSPSGESKVVTVCIH